MSVLLPCSFLCLICFFRDIGATFALCVVRLFARVEKSLLLRIPSAPNFAEYSHKRNIRELRKFCGKKTITRIRKDPVRKKSLETRNKKRDKHTYCRAPRGRVN